MHSHSLKFGLVAFGVMTLAVGYVAGRTTTADGAADAVAQGTPPQLMDVYYPGTETLGADEFRVTACGTGMPSVRPKQAAAC